MSDAYLWRYIASAEAPVLFAPLILILLPQWKYSPRVMNGLLLLVELIMLGEALLIYLFWGASPVTIYIVGNAAAASAFIFLIHCNRLRDGRLLFLLVTIVLAPSICDIITSTLFSRNCPEWIIANAVLSLCMYVFLYRYCRRPLHEMLESNSIKWGQVSVIPLSLTVTLVVFNVHSLNISRHRTAFIPALCLCATSVLIYVSLYHFQHALLTHAETLQYNALLESEIHFLEAQNSSSKAIDDKIRIFRHDTRHYLMLMQSCLAQDKIQDAQALLEIIKNLTDTTILSQENISYTGNPTIDTILNHARELAAASHVEFEVKLSVPDELRVNAVELAVVISNALENAIHAAAGCADGGRVSFQTKPCRQGMFLVISNTFSGRLTLSPKTGLPSTQEAGHGYGTLSIYNFARKYKCTLDCSVKEGIFYLRLLI